MGRWRNVRDNFMRFQRKRTQSGQAAETSRRYIYARHLDFLMGTRQNIPTEASSQAEEGDAEAVNKDPPASNIDETPGPSTRADPPPRRAAPTGPPRKRQIEEALLTFMQQRPTPTATPDDNEDKAFFNSLLPLVREFTPDQKIEFRLELLNMVKRYRSGLIPIQSRPPSHNFQTQTQLTPMHLNSDLQTPAPFSGLPSTSQITTQSYTSLPQMSPLSPFSQELGSPSSQVSQDSQYAYNLYHSNNNQQ